jgi:hypothetical protein
MKERESFRVYDKVRWHYPEGKDCPSMEAAKRHMEFTMRFLETNGLLSEDGKDLFSDGRIDDDFALTSEIVTADGDALLSKSYREWLERISYGGPLSTELFENTLREIRNRKKRLKMTEKSTGHKVRKPTKKHKTPKRNLD